MSATDVLIRAIQRQDYPQWLTLWDGYNEFYGRSGPTALAPAVTEMTWERLFDVYEPVHALVAEKQTASRSGPLPASKLVGLAHYLFHRSTIMISPMCYLADLFTDPSLRGQGIGRALIEAVYEQARIAGVARVYWQTHETNTTARRLYDTIAERSGFIIYRKAL